MIGCFLIGKDTTVCVRFLTDDSNLLTSWIDKFERGPCHVHLDSTKALSPYEHELKKWLDSSSSASALLLIDARSKQILEPAFLDLCKKAKDQGVFIGIFNDREDLAIDKITQFYQPNWILPIKATPETMQAKVNELLGVVRFTPFIANKKRLNQEPEAA